MRTLRSVNSAHVRKGLTGALAWLLSVAVLSLSAVPAYAEDKPRRKKAEAEAAAPPPQDVVPSTAEGAPTDAPASEAVDAAPPVQGPSPEAPVEPLSGEPLPAAEAEALPPAQSVEVPLEVAPPADIGPVAEPNHTASYVLWTASLVSLGIGTAYGVMALKAKKDFNDNPTTKLADRSHDRGIAADVSLGLGVVLAATGLAFFLAKDEPAKDTAASAPKSTRADLSVAPYVGRSAGGGNLSVRF